MQAPRLTNHLNGGETPATRRWYRPTTSRTGTLGLVVEGIIPFEIAHQLKQVFLLTPRDDLLKRTGYGGLFGALTAQIQSAVDQIRVKRKVGGDVLLLTHQSTQSNILSLITL